MSGNYIAPEIFYSNCKVPSKKKKKKYDSGTKMNIGFCSGEGHILNPELCVRKPQCISLLNNLLAKIYLGVLPTCKVNVLTNKWVEQINKKDWPSPGPSPEISGTRTDPQEFCGF